jgi:hypothetical protein
LANFDDHIAALREQTESHTKRLQELRELIRRAEEEAAVHEALVNLAQDDRVLATVMEHCDDPDLVILRVGDQLKRALLAGRRHPQVVSLDLSEGRRTHDRITAYLYCGEWVIEVGWDREKGFIAIPDTRRLRRLAAAVSYVYSERDVPGGGQGTVTSRNPD